jgi:hypothetical protein
VSGAPRVAEEPDATASHAEVSVGLIEALGIPLRAGRAFTAADRGQLVALVDEVFAARWLDGGSPLGRRLELGERDGERQVVVVGVVGSVRSQDLARDDEAPWFYTLDHQFTDGAYLAARLGDVAGGGEVLRAAVQRADPSTSLDSLAALRDRMRENLATRTTPMLLVGGFALLATVLAALGVYAVLALAVARRRVELGVRAALGADAASLLRLVLGLGARLVGCGLALGAAAAFAASALVAGQLFGVGRAEPAVYLGAAAALAAVAGLACAIPAARAAKSDPLLALRSE